MLKTESHFTTFSVCVTYTVLILLYDTAVRYRALFRDIPCVYMPFTESGCKSRVGTLCVRPARIFTESGWPQWPLGRSSHLSLVKTRFFGYQHQVW